MSEKRLKRELLKKKLFTKNRLVILNDDTFEEIFSLRLTLMNVFVVATSGTILIIFVTTFIIAFTPLREYIPGYASTKLRKEATEMALKCDSLSTALKKNEAYQQSIIKVLNGDLEYEKVNKDSILASDVTQINPEKAEVSKEELALRKQVETEEKRIKEESIKPTSLANLKLFGTADDDSGNGKYYQTKNNLPWAIQLPTSFAYPIEREPINKAYLKFNEWSESKGTLYPDWYKAIPSYRNTLKIY